MTASAQILRIAEMTTEDVRALDRDRTVVLLPGGIIEEHGPYLPSFTDGYLNEALTRALAEAIAAAKPGWRVVVFPTIPLGNSGANDIARRYSFPGTFTVRFETLRSVFMDLADELGALGLRWVFVLHLHGAPNHSRALDDAGDYFHDTFGGRMVHLAGLASIFSLIEGPKSPASASADGLPIHAGMDETSWLMHLRPHLVRRTYRTAPAFASGAMEGVAEMAARSDWPGYFGAPALATVAHGEAIWNRLREETARVALRILDGQDPAALPRLTASMTGAVDVALDAASRAAETERAVRQSRWITAHSK